MDERSNVARQFARNLHRCRRRAGLSQEEVGFRAALHRTEIGMLERGVRLPASTPPSSWPWRLRPEIAELTEGIAWRAPAFSAGGFDALAGEEPEPDAV